MAPPGMLDAFITFTAYRAMAFVIKKPLSRAEGSSGHWGASKQEVNAIFW